MKNRLKALLILRTPQPVEATPSQQNIGCLFVTTLYLMPNQIN